MANERIPLTDARRRFGAVVDKVRNGEHIELAEHGHPIAVMLPIDEYQSLVEYRAAHTES